MMAHRGADAYPAALLGDLAKLGDARDVHQWRGCARRSFRIGNRLWPPESSLASSPYCWISPSASFTEAARWYSNSDGYIVCASVVRPPPARAHLVGRVLDRLDDVLVAGASAEIALQHMANLGLRRLGVTAQQIDRGHDHPRRAITALATVLFQKPSCTGWSWPSWTSPSTVMISAPSACTASIVHDLTALPSTSTVQARIVMSRSRRGAGQPATSRR